MNWLHLALILGAAYLSVFLESFFNFPRRLLGAQIDLLPALMVYTALTNNVFVIAALALTGGLCFDALSANPLGVSVLPLLATGLVIDRFRDLLLRESAYAQFLLGAAASAWQPAAALFLMLNLGREPVLGWDALWSWVVLTLSGGLAAPLLFAFFDRIHRTFDYQPAHHISFRADREIKRGRQ
jgi:cell shape-determining protein MreD